MQFITASRTRASTGIGAARSGDGCPLVRATAKGGEFTSSKGHETTWEPSARIAERGTDGSGNSAGTRLVRACDRFISAAKHCSASRTWSLRCYGWAEGCQRHGIAGGRRSNRCIGARASPRCEARDRGHFNQFHRSAFGGRGLGHRYHQLQRRQRRGSHQNVFRKLKPAGCGALWTLDAGPGYPLFLARNLSTSVDCTQYGGRRSARVFSDCRSLIKSGEWQTVWG